MSDRKHSKRRTWLLFVGACILGPALLLLAYKFHCLPTVVPLIHGKPEYLTIHDAVAFGNLKDIKRHLGILTPIDQKDKKGNTPLHLAVRSKTTRYPALAKQTSSENQIVRFLIERGAKINLANNEGKTPLHVAARCCNDEGIEILLDAGARVDAVDTQGWTPLHDAARKSPTGIEILIRAGADIEAQSKFGRTPLHVAANYNGAKQANTLLDRGANIHAKDDYGYTPLLLASEPNFYRTGDVILTLLDHGASLKDVDNNGNTAIHLAHENIENLRLLLARGADIECKNKEGERPIDTAYKNYWRIDDASPFVQVLIDAGSPYTIHHALVVRDYEKVRRLLDDDPSLLQARDAKGRSLLHLAAFLDLGDFVQELIERGADVNARADSIGTPLHSSIFGWIYKQNGKQEEVVKMLLEAGADVNAKGWKGWTPLFYSVGRGRYAIAKMLIEQGANVNARNDKGTNVLDLAEEWKNEEAIEYLKLHGAR